jgi:hypothetical protein
LRYYVSDGEGNKKIQYNVFERRLADKLSYMDWKLSYVIDEEDFKFIHAKGTPRSASKDNQKAKNNAKEIKNEGAV